MLDISTTLKDIPKTHITNPIEENLNNDLQLKCPLCNATNHVLLKTYVVKKIIPEWIKLNINISSKFNNILKIELLKCNTCKLLFFNPNNISGSNDLYSQLEKLEWYYMPIKWEHNIALQDLDDCQQILEIGCGYGDFIKRVISEKGEFIEGIEFNESAVFQAQNQGLPVKSLDLKELAEKNPGQYDAICSFQVLEHVPNPKDFLELSCKLLKPNGKLILGLPNADSFLKYQFNILDMPPHHMTRWSSEILINLHRSFPIHLEHIKFEPLADYHIESYVNAYISLISRFLNLNNAVPIRIQRLISLFIKQSRVNKLLRGQTLYASFVRD